MCISYSLSDPCTFISPAERTPRPSVRIDRGNTWLVVSALPIIFADSFRDSPCKISPIILAPKLHDDTTPHWYILCLVPYKM